MSLHVKPSIFDWPVMVEKYLDIAKRQLQLTISIYDRSGVVQEFEDSFSNYVGQRRALAVSSGTAALHSALQHESFCLRYQPIVSLNQCETHHYCDCSVLFATMSAWN